MTGLGLPGGLDAGCTKHALCALSLPDTVISPDTIDIPPLDGYSPA
jgi:hypothetical protein